MIRKFSVTNPNSNQSAGSVSISPAGSAIASPTSQLESSNAGDDVKKLYAQSLESTENSVTNSHIAGLRSGLDPMLYPIGSEHDVSTDEGLSMSEEDDQLMVEHSELNKLLSDLDIDVKLKSAAQRGEGDLVKELLHNGAQVVADENGSTALHVAAQNGFAEVVRLLLEHGTDVDLPDSNGYTALHKAAGQGHLDVLELLINEGCDIDTQDDMYGNTPLHEAAWHGYSKSVDLLLKNKSNAFITNRAGCTALHLAAQNGHNQSGRTLLYGGCSPDVKNNYGDTPLHTAARYGHAGIARILISAKCSVDEQNKNGDTALHITSAFKRRKIAKLLIEAGIGSLVRNKQDETAVNIAQRKGHPEIIEIIYQTDKQTMHTTSQPQDEKTIKSPNNPTEPQESTADKDAKKKSHNAFVSWIRKKFSKKSSQSSKTKSDKDVTKQEGQDVAASSNNQYVKKPGFAYYRDLAGNIRQGPCGFVPAWHCEPGAAPMLNEPPVMKKELNYVEIKESQQYLSQRMTELKHAASKQKHFNGTNMVSGGRADGGSLNASSRQLPRNNTEKEQLEINKQLAQVENDLQELRGDLKTWLKIQAEDGNPNPDDNPFAYAIGHSQTRFGDDFDQERMTRYDVTEQFPPPPRLFRSRSDETLSHSEYSYHGRAFKSKEAAMEELKTLKHHEEIRARRRRIRVAGDDYDKQIPDKTRPNVAESKSNNSLADDQQRSQLARRHSSRPSLWQSRENIRQKDLLSDRDNVDSRQQGQPLTDVVPNSRQTTNTTDNIKYTTQLYNGQQQADPKSSNGIVPRPTVNSSHYWSTARGTSTLPSNTAQPSTYRLISAALTNGNSQNNQQDTARRPVPAQRSLSARRAASNVNEPAVRNATQSNQTAGRLPQQRPINGHQKTNMLYSEQSNTPSRLPTEPRQQPVSSKQYINEALSSQPVPISSRHPLPSYSQVQNQRVLASNSSIALAHRNHVADQVPRIAAHETRPLSNNEQTNCPNKPSTNVPLTALTGESCCGSSNPDSGYGGQIYDYYASQPSPQQNVGSQPTKEYESWYNRRLQDAARRINTYSALRPQRTMTSDV